MIPMVEDDFSGPPAASFRLSEAQRLDWLRLIRSENVGPRIFRELINHLGSARAALENLPQISRRGGKSRIQICPISNAEEEMEALYARGGKLIALGEPDYPSHLRYIDGAPPLLSASGNGDCLTRHNILAIVGARNASLSGSRLASQLAGELSALDITIVSGLARGIDHAAHHASIKQGTIAVLAGGLDKIYPQQHEPLLREILDCGGAVVSEMPLGWAPRARDFPRRNRLISGIALGVLLVEAARRSGSLHTARFALEQNREVMVVPGSPLDPRSEGGNKLIQQGATLITNTEDIINALTHLRGPAISPPPRILESEKEIQDWAFLAPTDDVRVKIVNAMGPAPVDIDELSRFTALPIRTVQIVLLELEIAGRIERCGYNQVMLTG